MEETVSRTRARNNCPNIPRVLKQMGARDGTEQIPDTAIESLTDKERDLIKDVVWIYMKWSSWWIDENPKPCEVQNSEKIANNLIKEVKNQHKALTISHLCREPKPTELSPGFGGSAYEASLLVMVYHLIWQLLSLNPKDKEDKAKLDLEILQALGVKNADWESALVVLKKVLIETPHLDCCIISLPSEPEDGSGSQKLEQFLDVLLSVRNSQGLALYFCTFGGSLILNRKEAIHHGSVG